MSSTSVIDGSPDMGWRTDLSRWIDHLLIHFDAVDLMLKSQQSAKAERTSTVALSESALRQLFQQAMHTLHVCTIPHFLRLTLYLRLGCLVMQYRVLTEQQIALGNLYHMLLQWLWECDPNWWEHCNLTETQGLTSSNRRVQALLQPLEDVIQVFLER